MNEATQRVRPALYRMHFPSDKNPSPDSPAAAAHGPSAAVAHAPLTSGFGSVLEKEHILQSSIEGVLRTAERVRPVDLDRILRHQQARIGTNIVLLEQRNEMLPHPARFLPLHGKHASIPTSRRTGPESASDGPLPKLVAQHVTVASDIDALIAHGSNGQRGDIILSEVARSHEEMAWLLTALLQEDRSTRDRLDQVAPENQPPGAAVARWENDGGALPETTER